MRQVALVLLSLVPLVAACDSGEPAAPPKSTPPTTSRAATPLDQLPGRIIVLDSNVVSISPVGEVETLTDDASDLVRYFQPTWAPDAQSIVASRVEGDSYSLRRIATSGIVLADQSTSTRAFYVFWNPDGNRIAYLGNGPIGLELHMIDFRDRAEYLVGAGQPFYFSFSPDGSSMVTYVGQGDLSVRDLSVQLDTERFDFDFADTGHFLNPVWTDRGIFYVQRGLLGDELVLEDGAGQKQAVVGTPSPVVFTTSQSGSRVAIQALGSLDGVSASLNEIPTLPLNRLVVINMDTGEHSTVTDDKAVAYFWDPTGTRLLILSGDPTQRTMRWQVWEDGELTEYSTYRPSPQFLDAYLPFFGQYAMSTSLWSPDGSAFTFAGQVEEESGIWIQQIGEPMPLKVADGTWAMWSPE